MIQRLAPEHEGRQTVPSPPTPLPHAGEGRLLSRHGEILGYTLGQVRAFIAADERAERVRLASQLALTAQAVRAEPKALDTPLKELAR